jgi:hypothetical protein
MTGRTLTHQLAAYLAAGTVTAVVAFLATIPFTDQLTLIGMTADSAVLAGWPTLLAADAVTSRRAGRR